MKNNKENGGATPENTSGNKITKSSSLKKQLVSGGVYIALAAAIVTVTMGSVSKIMNGDMGFTAPDLELESISEKSGNASDNGIVLPNLVSGTPSPTPGIKVESPISESDNNSTGKPVSGTKKGVNAQITEDSEKSDDKKQNYVSENDKTQKSYVPDTSVTGNSAPSNNSPDGKTPDTQVPNASNDSDAPDTPHLTDEATETSEYPTDPEDALFDGRFYKVASGYINRAFSMDELIYSPTMKDFRTHNGIDITGDPTSEVRLFSAGTITDIYTDSLMGKTVVVDHGDGVIAHYCNLAEELPQSTAIGAELPGGTVIGGIGNTAASECADVSHVHLSITKNGEFVDPAQFLAGK